MTEDEAETFMVETNVSQRGFSDLKITEQAEVIKLRHSKMFSEEKRQAIAHELQALEDSYKGVLDKTGEEYGMKKDSVARLLRGAELIPEYADWLNNKELAVRSAVELSYLSKDKQKMIYEAYSSADGSMAGKLDMGTAKAIRRLYKVNPDFTDDDLLELMDKKISKPKPETMKMPKDKFVKYFSNDMKEDEIFDIIAKALDEYYISHGISLL